MEETQLVKKAKAHAEDILSKLPADYKYHDLTHTKEVVEAAIEVGHKSNLSDDEIETVLLAAWFHDTGYAKGFEHHERASVELMSGILQDLEVEQERIDKIGEIILSTEMPQNPKDKLGQVLCDADLYHLSTSSFEARGENLRYEWSTMCNKDMTDEEWIISTIGFVKSHSYFTDYGKEVLEPKKAKNLEKLKEQKKLYKGKAITKLESQVAKLEEKLKQAKIQKPDRGIETMFRITSKNHLTLSGMADNKANIMISINSIILSVLVSVLFRKLDDYPHLILPGLILVIVCLVTIVFAVLATRPNVSSGTFTPEDVMNKKVNLLFFGNFHGMELDTYNWGMKEMMKDADFLYGSMIKDIYFLGIVLGKKYRMLRTSYTIFMFGFVVSITSFIISMLFFTPQA